MRKPFIPRGCDQQGRHPEAAHAACEQDDEQFDRVPFGLADLLFAAASAAAILSALLWWFS